MEIIDIVIIGFLVVGAIRGFMKGLIDQIASIAALLLGMVIATRFSDFTANLLTTKFNITGQYTAVIAFAVTFVVVMVGVHFVGKLVEKLVSIASLSFMNKLAGLLLGVVIWGFIVSVVLSVTDRFSLISEQTKEKSVMYGPVARIAPAVFPFLDFDDIKRGLDQITPDNSEEKNV